MAHSGRCLRSFQKGFSFYRPYVRYGKRFFVRRYPLLRTQGFPAETEMQGRLYDARVALDASADATECIVVG